MCAHSDDLQLNSPDYSDAEFPALPETLMPQDEPPLSPECANGAELRLFSEPEIIAEISQSQDIRTATAGAEVSLAVLSASLLTKLSFTDVPIGIPKLPICTSNFQDAESRNTGDSGTDELVAPCNVLGIRRTGRAPAALTCGSTRATPP